MGRDSSVDNSGSLRSGGSGDRILVRKSFSAFVIDGPGIRTASYAMGTGSFPGLKQSERALTIHPSPSAEVKVCRSVTSWRAIG